MFFLDYSNNDLRQISGTPISSTKKTDSHNITEILLKHYKSQPHNLDEI